MINLQNATIVNEKNTILTDVNFRVDVGEFVFLIGKTGAGKSSLLKLLYGDLPLHSGQGTIVGFASLFVIRNDKVAAAGAVRAARRGVWASFIEARQGSVTLVDHTLHH